MGIRGLTTYIAKRSNCYLEPHRLNGCFLVIDGNNLASQLYNWRSKCNCSFGGDYDRYASCVAAFFDLLRKCEISPLVVFDGGYEERKLCTVRQRFKNKIISAKCVTPMTQAKNKCFPILMKEVFKQVLQNLGISFAQCLYEADDEIAAIARRLQCPVLSYDSDFYVYDVMYIPLTTLQFEPSHYELFDNTYYINCNIYKIDNFLNSFGGLHKSLLPLMATLLGNDYIKRSVFSTFLSQIKLPKSRVMNETQRRIAGLLEWLRKETLESAIFKIMGHLKKNDRMFVAQQMKSIIARYMQCTSELLPLLSLPEVSLTTTNTDVYNMEISGLVGRERDEYANLTYEQNHDYLTFCSDSISKDIDANVTEEVDIDTKEQEEEENEFIGEQKTCSSKNIALESKISLPDWFKSSFQQGHLPSYFMDMLSHGLYFCPPQVEDYTFSHSHEISLPIIQVIYGLLIAGKERVNQCLTYHTRDTHAHPTKLMLTAAQSTLTLQFPVLENLADLSVEMRECLLFEAMELSLEDQQALASFPCDWRLFMSSLMYWARHAVQPVVNNCHIHALLFGFTVLNVVDGCAGYYRSKKMFVKDHGDTLKMLLKGRASCGVNVDAGMSTTHVLQDISDIPTSLASVSKDDCLLLIESLLPFHHIEEKLKSSPKLFSVATVHVFAQFQSCLFHAMHLNALLNFPVSQCQIARSFSGTLVYNAFKNFQKRSDVYAYIVHLFCNSPTVLALYKVLTQAVLNLLPNLPLLQRNRGRHHKKKAKLRISKAQTDPSNCKDSDDSQDSHSEVEFKDSNNRFLALCLLHGSE